MATVSAVVNNSKPVSDRLRGQVLEAIEALEYRQNLLARALYTKRSMSLAFLVPSIANPFFSSVLRSVEETAHRKGYSVFLGSTNGDPEKVEFYKDRLLAMAIDGVIAVLSWDLVSTDLIDTLRDKGTPVVGVAGSRLVPEIDCFVSDDVAAGKQAARYLVGLGHRSIAFVGAIDSQTTALRYEGVRQALAELGIESDPRLLVQVQGYAEADAFEAISQLVMNNVKFSAVVAFNDVMAIGVLGALQDQGFAVPGDVSVIGFDDTVSAYTRPKLTTVACPKEDLGEQGVLRLLERIEGDKSEPQVHRLPTTLIVRESARRYLFDGARPVLIG